MAKSWPTVYRCIAVSILIVVFTILVQCYDHEFEELPFCSRSPPVQESSKNSNLILVSTLDGKLSALDARDGGTTLWTIVTEPGGMLSSSISKMEITNQGQWIRLIPSLNGGLYKFNGETVEALPLTADTLLKSSFKFADDTIITGGKESRTYGIDTKTGKVRYECSMGGCNNNSDGSTDTEDILIIRRHTQMVRAVEPRTGIERWNFSVGQHDLTFVEGHDLGCESEDEEEFIISNEQVQEEDMDLRVIVPEGLICAVRPYSPREMVWKHKFDSPVVHAWRLVHGKLEALDLFSNTHIPFMGFDEDDNVQLPSPVLYIGMHNKQLYIQESVVIKDQINGAAGMQNTNTIASSPYYPRVLWKPYLATAVSRTPVIHHGYKPSTDTPLLLTHETIDEEITALAVRYGTEYPYDNGYYLFPEESSLYVDDVMHNLTHIKEEAGKEEEEEEDEDETLAVEYIIVGLWYWWKEVLLISFSTAYLVHLLFTRPLLHRMRVRLGRESVRQVIVVEKSVPVPVPQESDSGIESLSRRNPVNSTQAAGPKVSQFVSRYLTDFEPVQCLGRGGFGVVFEARNKIDDCHYAVKRICLPNKEHSREKVLREVKALAKLDHYNIVRYFNAWLECPPAVWMEEQDKLWQHSENLSGPTPLNTIDDTVSTEPYIKQVAILQAKKDKEEKLQQVLKFNPLKPFGGGVSDDELSLIPLQQGESDGFTTEFIGADLNDESESYSEIECVPKFLINDKLCVNNESDRLEKIPGSDDSVEIMFCSTTSIDDKSVVCVDIGTQSDQNANDSSRSVCDDDSVNDDDSVVNEDNGKVISFQTSHESNNRIQNNDIFSMYKLKKIETSDYSVGFERSLCDKCGGTECTLVCKYCINDEHSVSGNDNGLQVNISGEPSSSVEEKNRSIDRPSKLELNETTCSDESSSLRVYLYIQMQLCRKESLKDWLRAHIHSRDQLQVLHMFNQILHAVEYVHLQGLMHRDLKPSNIFFSYDGSVKVGDFGLVTAMAENIDSPSSCEEKRTGTPVTFHRHTDQVGTHLYMSPEQIAGHPYNHKVDIYSLGLIFFELLVPFNTQMERLRVMNDLHTLSFPLDFQDHHKEEYYLLCKMLSHDPDKRPTTFGIRASPPLVNLQDASVYDIPEEMHFTLHRKRETTRTESMSSNSSGSHSSKDFISVAYVEK